MHVRASFRPFSRLVPLLFLIPILLAGWVLTPETHSQSLPPNAEAISDLVSKLKAQQDQMAANQTKIEAQTTALKEQLRLAKLYSSRVGGHR